MIPEEPRKLRDTFALGAFQALIALAPSAAEAVEKRQGLADAAYQMADALISAKERVFPPRR